MADTLSVELRASVSWLFAEALGLSTVVDQSRVEFAQSLLDGTAADQADKIWHDTRSVAAGGADDVDLSALARTLFGVSVSLAMAKVKCLLLVNLSTTAGQKLVVGGAASGAFAGPFGGGGTSVVEVGADSALLLSNKKDGWSVSGSSHVLRVANPAASGSVSYKVVVVGTSA